ncbi:hypothetical protein [Actinomycetospora sp. TBRC 11914]|uniref:hypothetical protein n=1 Tax=Actinomycetospora sp. TBRC 11914 TaxID=2729387 RepID=UPI00145F81AB|nr:hypothetical protein [Actinomycetospora sp. TBRC 11914]NMO94088.1 hypothetical protein [Actinomycetospora sp. TBRC 11914]
MTPDADDPFGLRESFRTVSRQDGRTPLGYDPLDALTAVCLDTVPAAEAVAISYAAGSRVRSTHSTDPAVDTLDRRHGVHGRGPLLDQALAQPWYRCVAVVDDLASDALWGTTPDDGAAPVPFRALHSTTLRCARGSRTSLDLYAAGPRAFGAETTVLADMFAVRAATLLYGRDETGGARFDLAVDIISRRLGVLRVEAERLLLAHLHDRAGDPVSVARRLTRGGGPD